MPITLGDTSITSSTGDVGVAGTGSLVLPAGTTAQRPASPATGMQRFNTSTNTLEFYNGTSWSGVGKVGRIVNSTTDADISVGTSATIVTNVTITPLVAGGSFIVQPTLNFSQTSDNDTDFGMAMGYKIGSYSSTLSNYTQFGGNTDDGDRERPNGWFAWWSTDVIPNSLGTAYPHGYHTFQYAWSRQVTPSYTLGDSITFIMIVQADKLGIYINRAQQSSNNGGGLSSITVTEVMP